MILSLDDDDRALLDGGHGPGAKAAMELLLRYARVVDAESFVPIASAHIDGCLYHGPSGLDFVNRFRALGARVRVPTTMNVAAVDVTQPPLHRGDPALIAEQSDLTAGYVALGCMPTLTCAPYQRIIRPRFGEQVAWAESNAIVFANSVLGARTDRYGDFADLCAALTGRVPRSGLHLDARRIPRLSLHMSTIASAGLPRDLYFATVGYVTGTRAGSLVPVLSGLPADTTEDDLKALGAAAASSGSVALFHATGITPEAPSPNALAALDLPTLRVDATELHAAFARLCPVAPRDPVAAVCLGTPHFSWREFQDLAACIRDAGGPARVPVFVSTAREIAEAVRADAMAASFDAFGVTLVVDTCTYLAPVAPDAPGVILTNSAKWAHYGPGNLGRRAGLLDMARCITSAVAGVVVSS
ncbi:aconitase X [Gluconacetobacter tumulisoli]|uniref:DUF521 domain-containing protein n=1 Tax=Gluconacetobacter tumulisoli TaxID=1286189 RepID=A0A7W4PNP6_9PROT|nr:DUF521 domain-containing protein [Gluconacetobacter tumulisoli]